jgi:hypothetical protein
MGDALRALIDAVGLQVGPGAEVRSDDETWTLDVEPTGTHAWVATRSRSVWIRRGDDIAIVDAGTAALVEGQATITISTGPERSGPPDVAETYAFPHEALFALTGVIVGIDMSERTLERRCVAATGCSPAQLGRWYRSLSIRNALARGDRPREVAARFGFSTTSSMWRALTRVRPPMNRR